MFAYEDDRGTIKAAFTDRHGGVSGGPYASLNLASNGDDDEMAVAENLRRVTRAFTKEVGTTDGAGVLARMHQVHGSSVEIIDLHAPEPAAPCDGLVTASPGLVLMVRVADCVPVLLGDVERGVVGAVHAGRPGLVLGVVPATVDRMRERGASDLVGWVGPHVCGRCYEVPESMRDEVAAAVPESFSRTSWGTPALDIGAGVRAQLEGAGVAVVDATRCTREDEDLYSYRRQGSASGRFAGLVWVRP